MDVAIDCEPPLNTEIVVPGTIIISQNYPAFYENYKDCAITVRFHHKVRITFLAFKVEQHSSCNYDYLKIFDGPTSSYSQIGSKLCGLTTPQPIESTGNLLHITFHSDSSSANAGFRLLAEELGRQFLYPA